MLHTPFGYDIVGGTAVINEADAEKVRKICENYLSGMSFIKAAADVGMEMKHSGVKRLIQNPRYLGDDFYPAILTKEIVQAVEEERLRRDAEYKGTRKRKDPVKHTVFTKFRMERPQKLYDDPIKQIEYAYSLIESEVS